MAAIETHSTGQSPRHADLRHHRPDSWGDLGLLVPHQQKALDQFLRALRRRIRPGLPRTLLLGHRYQTLARRLDQTLPRLRQKLDHSLRAGVALRDLSIPFRRTTAWREAERTRLHLSALLRPTWKPQLRLATLLSSVCAGMSGPHLAAGSQKNLPQDLKQYEKEN